MKLTAPPPGTAVETPSESPPAAEDTSPAAPVVPYEKPPERPATWPTWFGPTDAALAVLTVALAFLAASFAARNSDVWLHLAAGQRLANGEYKLGTDPFSYTGKDRLWVNHSWLFDFGAYSLFSGEGTLLVAVKALAVAGAFALLLAMRRRGQSLWPWALLAIFGVLASASVLAMRPIIASIFFLALTLWLVFRLPSPPGSWKLPVAIGVVFVLWSNSDGWFIIGPLALLLLLAGELVRKQLRADALDPADPLSSLLDAATLGKALIVGVLACMLNPHHVGVWELPFELVGAEGAAGDPRIRVVMMSPLKNYSQYWTVDALGMNAGGIAYGLLLLAGIYVAFLSAAVGRFFGFVVELEALPLPLLFLWAGFAALSLLTMFGIPFLALVTIPLVASRCNLYSSRVKLGSVAESRTRMLVTASSAGRLATAFTLLLLGVAALPGWLHPPASCWWESETAHPANTRRVEWRVESDPDMQQAAEFLKAARANGTLPPETLGFASSMDFANYCAWFAPQEKVFLNGRPAFHRPELAEFATVRRGLGIIRDKAEPPDPNESLEVLRKWNASYVIVANQRGDRELNRVLLNELRSSMWVFWEVWSPWYLNGRTAISGFRIGKNPDPAFERLELDPGAIAFDPDQKRVPNAETLPPLVQATAWDELFTARKPTPTGAEEALAWLRFKERAQRRNLVNQLTFSLLRLNQPGLAAPILPQSMFLGREEALWRAGQIENSLAAPFDGSFRTYPILALRAARRAIAEDPNHPDGYFALAQALADRDLPIGDGERSISMVTALQQCLQRMPKPENYRRNFNIASPSEVCERLAMYYLGRRFPSGEFQGLRVDMGSLGEFTDAGIVHRLPAAAGNKVQIVRVPAAMVGQLPPGSSQVAAGLHIYPLDLRQQLLASAEEYAKLEITDPERRSETLKRLEEARKVVDATHRKALDDYRTRSERMPKLRERHRLALSLGLVNAALNDLSSADLAKEFGEEQPIVFFRVIATQLAVGKLEEAAGNLATLRGMVSEIAAKPGANKDAVAFLNRSVAELEFAGLLLEGNYESAGKQLESLEGAAVGLAVHLDEIAKNNIDPAKYKNVEVVGRRMSDLNVAWPLIPMLAVPIGPGEPLGVFTSYWAGRSQLEHFERLFRARQAISAKMQRDADFYFRRGFLALLEGDIAGAKARFSNASQKAPPGWGVPDIRHLGAENFLHQIERAAKAKTP